MGTTDQRRRAQAFLRDAHLYRLGNLPTERPHPSTWGLSGWARDDLPRAIETLKRVDLEALLSLDPLASRIDALGRRVEETLERGRRVFLCGCGATGRLALSLEFLWRQRHPGDDRIVAFMAGGDTALVHALEGFEDHPPYGARHLEELGFVDGDLLIACTEGGETPYVLGAAERAAQVSSTRPCLLYCNDEQILADEVERFRRVHGNPGVEKLCLPVGPMALAGSTRMQASTVLQLAVGHALLERRLPADRFIGEFRRAVEACDFDFLDAFVRAESEIYAAGDFVTYRVRDYGITVFTDTTERAPTFSLIPFDRFDKDRDRTSLCYVVLDDCDTPEQAWAGLLNRPPRPLDWPEVDGRTSAGYLSEFDFSAGAAERRRRLAPGSTHHEFRIRDRSNGIELVLGPLARRIETGDMTALARHLLLKQVLNVHSTLVMGRLGRYQGNLMTWVTPTNGKLIDRATRYVGHLLERAGHTGHAYDEIVHELFDEMARRRPDESVVLATYRVMLRKGKNGKRRGISRHPGLRLS
jgi:N-acetylmuramic acid 6-phosphate etherase